jgi:zinc D-Ala-D-Ala carboxypeptidase
MNLSKNLTLAEMVNSATAKRLGIDNHPTPEHFENMKFLAVKVFQPIRNHFGVPIFISSGYRSEVLNKNTKGASRTSQHSKGQAMDIDMDNTSISNKQVFDFIKENLDFDQLINEFDYSWIHVSYSKNGNRKQILNAKKVGKKTVYEKN